MSLKLYYAFVFFLLQSLTSITYTLVICYFPRELVLFILYWDFISRKQSIITRGIIQKSSTAYLEGHNQNYVSLTLNQNFQRLGNNSYYVQLVDQQKRMSGDSSLTVAITADVWILYSFLCIRNLHWK